MLIKLNLQRFANSNPSSSGETWLLNEKSKQDELAGTWVFNDEPDIENELFAYKYYSITFTSNNKTFDNLTYNGKDTTSYLQYSGSENIDVYVYNFDSGYSIGWVDNAYKTITITSKLSEVTNGDALLTWLQANATKQQPTEITYTCKWFLDGTLVNTSTFSHEQLTGVDYNVLGSVFKVMLSAETLAQYDYGVNLNGETSNASLGSDNVITIEAFKSNIVFNITSNGTTTLATKNTYIPCDIDFNVNVESGASLLDITVTFKVEDTNYQITSINSGNKIPQPIVSPTLSGKLFQGWYDSVSGGNKITFPLSPTSDQDIYAQFINVTVATVSGLGSADPSAVTFDVPSDFKFTDGEYTDSSGNVFVKIPKMYRKVNTVSNGQITSFSISNVKIDDNYKIYPVFLAEDGVTELDWVGIGKGMSTSNTKLNTSSQSSGSTKEMTLSTGRKSLTNYYNSNYQLYDWMFHKLWQDLIICKMQTVNTNSGSGITQDQLGIYWKSSGQWVDGFGHVESYVYLCDKPSKYVDSPTASTDGYFTTSYRISTAEGLEVKKLGYDEMHPFVNLPTENISNSNYDTYYCDTYYYNNGNRPFHCDVGYTAAYNGAFDLVGADGWSSTRGVRLCYRPLA